MKFHHHKFIVKARWLLLVPVLIAGCGDGQSRPHLKTLKLVRDGNQQLIEAKGDTAINYHTALDKYLEALSYDPFAESLHLNLGLSFEGLKQADKALQAYQEAENLALKEKNFKLVFMARFNQAQLLGKSKKIDEALAVYQKALEIIPSSKEVKTNIELLTQGQQGGQDGQDNKQQNQQGDQNQEQKNQQGEKDQKDDKDQKDQQDQKDQKDGQGEDPKDKKVQQSKQYMPREFKGELSEGDVKKILGELKQQEEKIRAEYNRKEVKERPRDKDW